MSLAKTRWVQCPALEILKYKELEELTTQEIMDIYLIIKRDIPRRRVKSIKLYRGILINDLKSALFFCDKLSGLLKKSPTTLMNKVLSKGGGLLPSE